MPTISTEQLQNASIKAVEAFLNDRVPLSEGLAKQASLLQLNHEQIQRAVEATNSIAYLKIVKIASDRTVEFPLCKTAEVMAHLVNPNIEKQAGIISSVIGMADDIPALLLNKKKNSEPQQTNPVEKVATVTITSPTQMYSILTKMAAENKRQLELSRDELITKVAKLNKVACELAKDERAFAKLSYEWKDLCLGGLDKTYIEKFSSLDNQVSGFFIFKEAELKLTKEFIKVSKEVEELKKGIEKKASLAEKAEQAQSTFFFVKKADSAQGPINKALSGAAGTVGSAIGKTVGYIPGKAVEGIGTGAKTLINNTISNVKATKNTPKLFGLGTLGGKALNIATDAAMYSPKPESNIAYQMKHVGPY